MDRVDLRTPLSLESLLDRASNKLTTPLGVIEGRI